MTSGQRRVAVISAEKFEDSEATDRIAALQEAATVTVVGLETGTLTGKALARPSRPRTPWRTCRPRTSTCSSSRAGGSPENLRIDDSAVAFTRSFVESGKPVAFDLPRPATAHLGQGPQGRTVTAVNKIQTTSRTPATYVDEEVCIDGNLISLPRSTTCPPSTGRSSTRCRRSPTGAACRPL